MSSLLLLLLLPLPEGADAATGAAGSLAGGCLCVSRRPCPVFARMVGTAGQTDFGEHPNLAHRVCPLADPGPRDPLPYPGPWHPNPVAPAEPFSAGLRLQGVGLTARRLADAAGVVGRYKLSLVEKKKQPVVRPTVKVVAKWLPSVFFLMPAGWSASGSLL